MDDVLLFFENDASIEQCLDIIEIIGRLIENWTAKLSDYGREQHGINQDSKDAIDEVNHRLRRGGIGFQYESGNVIRVDAQHVHATVIVPALRILASDEFATVNSEYRKAHQHYRNDELEACLVECLKSLESMLKIICHKNSWTIPAKATAQTLIKVVCENGLFPPFVAGEITALRATIEQGVPVLRNQLAGHGQGTSVRDVSGPIAAYTLHLTASTLLLLSSLAST